MKLRLQLFPLVLAFAPLAAPGVAAADFNLSFGLRYEPARYTLPQIATSHPTGDIASPGANGTSTLPSNSSVNAFQRQDMGATIGLGFTDKLTITISLDFAKASLSHNDSDSNPTTRGFSTFGLGVGVKWNFVTPAKNKVTPYIYGDFFKYFAALNDDRPNNLPQNEVEFSAGLAAPLGFRIAFGLEYWFSDNFAIGADIFGLQGAFSSGSLRRVDTAGGDPITHEQSLNTINFYTSINLIFRFPNLVKYGGGTRYRYRETDERD